MADQVGFRVGFRGFNKQDVLTYIDTMQREADARLKAEEKRRLSLEEDYSTAVREAEQYRAAAEEAQQTLSEQKEQFEQLTALAQVYKTEILRLREQAEQSDASRDADDALSQANDRIAHLEERVALLTAQNARYAKIVGDVNRLVVEARVVSESYLDAAQDKSTECIRHLELFLDDLKGQAAQAKETSDNRRKLGGDYIETLLTDLQELGKTVKNEE